MGALKDGDPGVRAAVVEALSQAVGREMRELLAGFEGKSACARFAVTETAGVLLARLAGPPP